MKFFLGTLFEFFLGTLFGVIGSGFSFLVYLAAKDEQRCGNCINCHAAAKHMPCLKCTCDDSVNFYCPEHAEERFKYLEQRGAGEWEKF